MASEHPINVDELPAGLVDAGTQAQDALQRADTKATTLLKLVGLALAGVIALVNSDPTGAALTLLWLALAPILASVVLLLVTILPRLNRDPVPGTWLYAAQVGPSTLLDTYTATTPTATATHVCVIAQRARRKYQYVQAAVGLLVAGLPLLVAALAVIA